MGRHAELAAVFGLVLLVALVAGAAAPVTATTAYAEPDDACEGTSGTTMVAMLADGSVLTEDASLYAGTEIEVTLCDGGTAMPAGPDGAWELDDAASFTVVEHGDSSVTVDLDVAGSTVDLFEQVEDWSADADEVDSIELTVLGGAAETTGLDEPSELRFADDSDADAFAESRDEYHDATDEIEELADSGEFDTIAAEYEENEDQLDAAHAAVESALFDAALAGDDEAAAALAAFDEDRDETQNSLEAAIEEAESDAASAEWNARLRIAGLLFGSFLGTGVVGVFVGRRLTRPKLDAVARDRMRNASIEFGLRPFLRPALLAVVALAVTLAAVVALDGVTPLVEGIV